MTISIFIDACVSAALFAIIFSNSLSETIKFRYQFLMFLVTLFCNFFLIQYSWVGYLTIFLLEIIIVIATKNHLINVLASLGGYILSITSNYLLLFLIQLLLSMSIVDLYSKLTYQILFYIVYLAIAYALTYLLGRFMKKHFATGIDMNHRSTFRLIFLELLLFSIILVFNITYGRQIGYPARFIAFNSVLFFVYFLISTALLINILRSNHKLILAEQKEQQYAQLRDYMHTLEQTSLKLRKFKHDYLNTFLTLDSLIHTNPDDKDFQQKHQYLISYFDQNIKPERARIQAVDTQFVGLANLSDPGLKSLFSVKLGLASMEHMNVRLEIADPVSSLPMNSIDIARILGIFMDNAIEAAEASKDTIPPFVHVAFIQMEDSLHIVIENSCCSDAVSLDKLSDYGYTTKKEHQGYGLHEASRILDQYPHVTLQTTCLDDVFTQTLYMDTKEKN